MPENSQPVTKLQPRQALPIERVLSDVLKSVERDPITLLIAEPGAGKTTVLPLAFARSTFLSDKKIIMLEPRRVAARSAAQYLAEQLGEKTGQRVGYRIRGESRVGSHTQIEINTEGTLTRLLHEDPSLDGVGLIIFDEFHERSLHADLALALTLEVQRTIRPDLRILIMSATLDQQGLTHALGDLPCIHGEGRSFAVDIHYAERDVVTPLPERVSDYVLRALKNHDGDILVFLPGRHEIRLAAEKLIAQIDTTLVSVICFHASSSPREQRDALTADPHRRRVILATTIAETSLTVPGVRVVIDSGLVNVPMFDVSRGFTSLKTTRITQASATQRSGRAGRLGSGVCYRLWTKSEDSQLTPHYTPEIAQADLSSLVLNLARWGESDPRHYTFIDQPPESSVRSAQSLLRMLGAIDEQNKITPRGRTIAQLGVHPRIGRLLTGDESMSNPAVSCWVAAALSEAKVAPDFSQDTLISERISFAQASRTPSALRVTEEARRIAELLQIPFTELNRPCDSEAIAIATAKAFPERVAMKRMGATDTYLTREGLGVVTRNSTLARHEFLAIAHLDGKGANARVLVAEPLPQDSVLQLFEEGITHATVISWDRDSQSVRALEEHRLGSLVLKTSPIRPDENRARELLLAELMRDELRPLPWSATLVEAIDRVEWLNARGALPQTLRPLLRAALLTEVDLWLTDSLHGKSSYRELSALPLEELIWSRISWKDRALLDSCAPPRIPLPSGRSAAICYSGERAPSISVKLQEMFGLQAHPSIAQNTVPLTIELLSPAGRPLQITRDIKSFWQSAYPEVRKEMAGRYPKHPWPLDPEQALATHRAKPRK